jgi:hypothetical protein
MERGSNSDPGSRNRNSGVVLNVFHLFQWWAGACENLARQESNAPPLIRSHQSLRFPEIRLPHARVRNAHAWSLVPKSQNRAHTKNDDVTFPTLAESEVVQSFLGGSDVHSGCG